MSPQEFAKYKRDLKKQKRKEKKKAKKLGRQTNVQRNFAAEQIRKDAEAADEGRERANPFAGSGTRMGGDGPGL